MKFLVVATTLLFLTLALAAALFAVKLASMERRIAGIPESAAVDKRFLDLEAAVDSIRSDSFRTNTRIRERLAALEAGQGKPVLSGPETLDYLIASLQQDFLSLPDVTTADPGAEPVLRERMEKTIAKLEDKSEAGEEVTPALMGSLRMSADPEWKAYLVRDVIWRMGSKDELVQFFDSRDNEARLRALAAHSVMKLGGRPELERFAAALSDPGEDLTVKTSLARLFQEHPIAAAEPGLIEGVEGKIDPETKDRTPYAAQHRYACLWALSSHDSARAVEFLERFLYAAGDSEEDPYAVNIALHAYGAIQREQAAEFFKMLKDQHPGLPKDMADLMDSLTAKYAAGGSSGGE